MPTREPLGTTSEAGPLRRSFVGPRPIGALRNLSRYRTHIGEHQHQRTCCDNALRPHSDLRRPGSSLSLAFVQDGEGGLSPLERHERADWLAGGRA